MARSQIIGKIVGAPSGWEWENGFLRPEGDAISADKFDAVYKWAKLKGYGLEPHSAIGMYTKSGAYQEVYCVYTVWKNSWDITEKYLGDGKWESDPRFTGGSLSNPSLGTIEIVVKGVPIWNRCASCLRAGLKTRYCESFGGIQRLCAYCSTPCANDCGKWTSCSVASSAAGGGKCLGCFPRIACYICGTYAAKEDSETIEGRSTCKPCAAARRCSGCGVVDNARTRKFEEKRLCEACYGKAIDSKRVIHETFDAEELPPHGDLTLKALPNRPVRVISVETEVDGDPATIATTLYNCGIVREAFVEAYGTRVPEDSSWPAFLKHDGSVTGGEVITFLLKLDESEHGDALKNVLSKLRSLNKVGAVEYNANCGGHIHIDAHNFSSDNLWRLLTVYNYLEDVIYRLAGAGHAYGHRTLVGGHDRANGGHGYAKNTSKGPWGVKSNAFAAAASQDRMTGLNFVPYMQAIRDCLCGARQEDNLRKCTCTLRKCTIEWRVWNTQANPRIIHGWLAFMQSLHAWADSAREMTKAEEEEYSPLGWTKRAWSSTSAAHKEVALERVRWIFSNLVFTDAERDSLLYAFSKTDIVFPTGFLDEMRKIPTPRNRPVKAPHYRFCRRVPIEVRPPAKKMHGKIQRNGPGPGRIDINPFPDLAREYARAARRVR